MGQGLEELQCNSSARKASIGGLGHWFQRSSRLQRRNGTQTHECPGSNPSLWLEELWPKKGTIIIDNKEVKAREEKSDDKCKNEEDPQNCTKHNGLKSQIIGITCNFSWIIILIFSNLGNGNVTKMWIKW